MTFSKFDHEHAWPVVPRPPGDWKPLVRQEAEGLTASAADSLKQAGYLVLAARAVPALFYPGRLLLDLLIELSATKETGILSYVAGQELDPLDGDSRTIHELNAAVPIALPDADSVERYLRFFCYHIRSDGGSFLVIDDLDNLAWPNDTVPEDIRERVAGEISPLKFEPPAENDDPGHWIRATMYYSRQLFRVHFQVSPKGKVEMLDDEVITVGMADEKLPLPDQRFEGPVRIIGDMNG